MNICKLLKVFGQETQLMTYYIYIYYIYIHIILYIHVYIYVYSSVDKQYLDIFPVYEISDYCY